MLLSRFVPASELNWAERLDEIPARLVPLAALTAAAHAYNLSIEGARSVATALESLQTPMANDALVRLAAQRPELEVTYRRGQNAYGQNLMGELSDLIESRDGSSFVDKHVAHVLSRVAERPGLPAHSGDGGVPVSPGRGHR